jgi:dienelactone hydrolase
MFFPRLFRRSAFCFVALASAEALFGAGVSTSAGAAGRTTELHTLSDGKRCLLIGLRAGPSQPLLFIFQGSLDTALTEPLYTEVGQILAADGVLSVVLDAPAHGADAVPGEPTELNGWAQRLAAGKPLLAPFLSQASAVIDDFIARGWADPQRIAACGTSRGGFLAFHFAAHDRRIRAAAGIAPVTDLAALREFSSLNPPPDASGLALAKLAPELAGRPIWLCIGNDDSRVDTERAIGFARAVVAANRALAHPPSPIPVDLLVQSTPGHRSSAADHRRLSEWLRPHLGLPAKAE